MSPSTVESWLNNVNKVSEWIVTWIKAKRANKMNLAERPKWCNSAITVNSKSSQIDKKVCENGSVYFLKGGQDENNLPPHRELHLITVVTF